MRPATGRPEGRRTRRVPGCDGIHGGDERREKRGPDLLGCCWNALRRPDSGHVRPETCELREVRVLSGGEKRRGFWFQATAFSLIQPAVAILPRPLNFVPHSTSAKEH